MNYLIGFSNITFYFSLNDVGGSCLINMVNFQNELAKNIVLKVNCTSRNDNLGNHFVAFKGVPFEIKCHEITLGKTEWFCTVRHGKFSKYFRAYKKTFIPRCGQKRFYTARFDGIYLSKNLGPNSVMNTWDQLP